MCVLCSNVCGSLMTYVRRVGGWMEGLAASALLRTLVLMAVMPGASDWRSAQFGEHPEPQVVGLSRRRRCFDCVFVLL